MEAGGSRGSAWSLLHRISWVDVLACPCGSHSALVGDISARDVVVALLRGLPARLSWIATTGVMGPASGVPVISWFSHCAMLLSRPRRYLLHP